VDELHGHHVADPYRWLEDATSTETARWQAAQDELWQGYADGLPQRDRLRARVAELSDTGLVTAPTWRGERRFFLRQNAGQDHPVLYTAGRDGTEHVLVDPTAVDGSGRTTLDTWQPDLDGRLLAYQLSSGGTERALLYVLDVRSGRLVDGPLDRCRYSPVAWLAGGEAFYYVRAAPDGGARHVYLHKVGTSCDNDVLVFGADRADTGYGLQTSEDGRWLTVAASRGTAPGNDIWLADLADSPVERPELRVVQEGVAARTVATVGSDGRLYVVTDRDAPRGRVCVGDPARPAEWTELVAEDDSSVLTGIALLDRVLLVGRTRHAIGEIGLYDLAGGTRVGDVPLPGFGSVGTMSTRGHEAWFSYTDSVTPRGVYRYDARTCRTTRWAAAPGVAEIPDVTSRQIECESADGTPVRVVVFGRAGAGPRPTILYGYGGFGLPLTPTYSSYLLAWVEAGGVFATAQLRGGGEEGAEWHRAGMLGQKQNVFDDFFAVAERLIADGWTTREQLGICGESNGGLLVGAALTQRPELFAAAVCSAPVLDMLRYERLGGASWRTEYGSADDPEQFDWLLDYSPYHHVRSDVDYPAVLFTSFGGDTRVDPAHARKMCAALQYATTGERPVLLRHEDGVGHARSATTFAVALAADMLAFLAAATCLEWTTS
jgi:prolyl oligopeptidase